MSNKEIINAVRMSKLNELVMARRRSAHQQRIDAFHGKIAETCGIDEPTSTPHVPDDKIILSRCKLILEEALEVFEACGVKFYLAESGRTTEHITKKDVRLYTNEDQTASLDLPHIAKELADLSVVTIGTFSHFGISDIPILEEVDANNLAKFGPGGYMDENRKWRKPPNHPTPDLGTVLKAQGWSNPEVYANEVQQDEDVLLPSRRQNEERQEEKSVS